MTAAILTDGSGWYQLLTFYRGCPASDSIRVDISSLPLLLPTVSFGVRKTLLLLDTMPPTAPTLINGATAPYPFTSGFAPGNYSLTVTDASAAAARTLFR